jgi:hypothetical protein
MATVITRQKSKSKEEVEVAQSKELKVESELTDKQILDLVDQGIVADRQEKAGKKIKAKIKETLQPIALQRKIGEFVGALGTLTVSDDEDTAIDPKKFHNLLKKLKKESLFYSLISVKMGEAKKYLGETSLEPIITRDPKPFSKFSYKPKK